MPERPPGTPSPAGSERRAAVLFGLRGGSVREAIDVILRALADAGYGHEECIELLGGALVNEAVRGYWAEGSTAADAHDRLRADDPELAVLVEALAPFLLGRAESRGEHEAALAAVEALLGGLGE